MQKSQYGVSKENKHANNLNNRLYGIFMKIIIGSIVKIAAKVRIYKSVN
jgi:hypothetical protein